MEEVDHKAALYFIWYFLYFTGWTCTLITIYDFLSSINTLLLLFLQASDLKDQQQNINDITS